MRVIAILKAFLQYFTMLFGIVLAIVTIMLCERSKTSLTDFNDNLLSDEVSVEGDDVAAEVEDEKSESILIPHCGDITYSISDNVSDFSFHNPSKNNCLLRVTITRRDTSEAIYISPLLGVGSNIDKVAFFKPITAVGNYEAMIKIDAYKNDFDKFPLVNSMVIDTTITAQ